MKYTSKQDGGSSRECSCCLLLLFSMETDLASPWPASPLQLVWQRFFLLSVPPNLVVYVYANVWTLTIITTDHFQRHNHLSSKITNLFAKRSISKILCNMKFIIRNGVFCNTRSPFWQKNILQSSLNWHSELLCARRFFRLRISWDNISD